MTRLHRAAAQLALLAPLSLAACADSSRPPAASPEAPPIGAFAAGRPREPSPVDQEMLAIGRAEEEIDRTFPETNGLKRGPKAAAPLSPPPPPPPPADAGKPDQPKLKDDAHPLSGDPCAVACRALTSMVSAADRLCKLAGENDGRCDDARARVRGASGRVKSSCPGCSVSPAPAAAPPRGAPGPGEEPPKAPAPAPGMPGSTSMPIP